MDVMGIIEKTDLQKIDINNDKIRGICETMLELEPNLSESGREFLERIMSLAEENHTIFQNYMEKIGALRARSDIELEDKLPRINKELDCISSGLPGTDDYIANRKLCERKYSAFWSKLDEESKTFLITANYLYRKCRNERYDFSPVILEMSRTYENELLAKIFRDFVEQQASSENILQPDGKKDALYKAVDDFKKDEFFFISLTQMVKIIYRLGKQKKALTVMSSSVRFNPVGI